MKNNKAYIPLALYVHMPWCESKCPYCDFNSHPLKGSIPSDLYIETLLEDLASVEKFYYQRPFTTVFFGGGTPSLFEAKYIDTILSYLLRNGLLESDAEITLEANPGSSETKRFLEYRSHGINRLSIGIQSFNDQSLKNIGRIHTSKHAIEACSSAISAGFDNFNIDLMYGLPDQSLDDSINDLKLALEANPSHLSIYQLTIEPNTYFSKHPPTLPSEEKNWASRCSLIELAAEFGYLHYEVSAFAKKNHQCKHNLNYWLFGDYIGIGAGAHSKISARDSTYRWSRPRHPRKYMSISSSCLPANIKTLKPTDLIFEFFLNALRLKNGFQLDLFTQRTGLSNSTIKELISQAIADGLLINDKNQISTTPIGWRFLDTVLLRFLNTNS